MDESGHSGDTGAADSGNGADARERVRVNGWATPDSPWSHAASTLDDQDDVPSWRRAPADSGRSTAFPRSAVFPSSSVPASGMPAPAPPPPGFVDSQRPVSPRPESQRSGEIPPSGERRPVPDDSRWSETRPRYSDLLAHLSPPGGEPARPPSPRSDAPDPGRPTSLRGFDVPTPNSAPPYPYEGDLDDVAPPPPQRAPVPMVRPAAPGTRRSEWAPAETESARHALSSPTQGMPRVEPRVSPASAQAPPARPSYDPSSFPRRLAYDPAPAPESSAYVPPAAYAAFDRAPGASDPRPDDPAARVLPQRVPAQPDVPTVPEPPLVEPTAETPALARIATHLRRGDTRPAQERQEGFDVQAILGAVRSVDGVRDASLRSTPTGAHSLRLDLAEGADPAEVSRQVARLLSERMGLDAAMKGETLPFPPAPAPVSPPAALPGERRSRPVSAPPVAPAQASAPPAETRTDLRSDIRPQLPEARSELRPENLASVRPESRPEVLTESHAGPRPDSRSELRPESRPDVLSESRTFGESRAAEETTRLTPAVPPRQAPSPESRPAQPVEQRPAQTSEPRRASASQPAPTSESRPASAPESRPTPTAESLPAATSEPRLMPSSEPRLMPSSEPRLMPASEQRLMSSSEPRLMPGPEPRLMPPVEPRLTPSEDPRLTPPAEPRPTSSEPRAMPAAPLPTPAEPRATPAEPRPTLTEPRPTPVEPRATPAEPEPRPAPAAETRPESRPAADRPQTPAPPPAAPQQRHAQPQEPPARVSAPERERSAEVSATAAPERKRPVITPRDSGDKRHDSSAVEPTDADCGPPRPLYPGEHPGPRVVIDNVHVNTYGTDADVQVHLSVGNRTASGTASGPAVDGYLLRLCAMAAAGAVDELLSTSDHPDGPARCFVEHAAAVPFGASQVAVVVLLLSCNGWVEQLAGSAVVVSDDRHAMVRATLAAVNRRLEALLTR